MLPELQIIFVLKILERQYNYYTTIMHSVYTLLIVLVICKKVLSTNFSDPYIIDSKVKLEINWKNGRMKIK